MVALDALKPTDRLLVMDLVADAGLDVSDWANYAGKHPASNPRYCYEWIFTQDGMPSVACLWFANIELTSDGSVLQRLNLWDVAKKHESLPGRSSIAKRARAMDMALQAAFRTRSPIRVIIVNGEQADLVAQNAKSSRVEHRGLDPSTWSVAEYDWTTGDCLLVRDEAELPDVTELQTLSHSSITDVDDDRPAQTPTYVTRLSYNSQGWRRPATAAEVQESEGTYRSENGFGQEDWLFRDEWQIDGWRYGFVQGVNNSRTKLLREGRPFNLRLFTMPAPGDRRAVAEILGVQCLDDSKADAAVAEYERRGWLDTMRDEIAAAGGRPEALNETAYAPHILNLRYRSEGVRLLDGGARLPPDDPTHRLKRYGLYGTPGAMDQALDLTGKPIGEQLGVIARLTVDDFAQALDRIEMSDDQRRWLVGHHYFPDATTSMLRLANALGYSDHRAANGAYGALARRIAEELPHPPEDVPDGEYTDWLEAVAKLVERDASDHSQWRLRDEVVDAMLKRGWIETRDAIDGEAMDLPTPDDQSLAREYGLDDTQIKQMMLSRRGQGRFRSESLRFWGGGCAVSCVTAGAFLVASHIKPWRDASPTERLDGFNGLPLTPNLDRAFDRGYVSFAQDGIIMISPRMSMELMQALGIQSDMKLRLQHPRIDAYMAYHREHVFLR